MEAASSVLFAGLLGMLPPVALAAGGGERFTAYAGVELGVGTLDDVQRKLGAADVIRTGDAGESEARICYRVPGGNVSFLSSELGGGTDLIGYAVSELPREGCATWPRDVPAPSMESGGLRLGMNKRQFRASVGGAFDWDNGKGVAIFDSRRKPTDVESARLPAGARFDVTISVTGSFVNGKLAAIEVWRVETF